MTQTKKSGMLKIVELIVPCYNEEQCIALFYERIQQVFRSLQYYRFLITYIDDGSKDQTLAEIKKIMQRSQLDRDGKVQFISFSRNFGKEAAIYAGLSRCSGDYIAILDADLQHPPELLKEMLFAVETEGYDCASARRISRRGEPIVRSIFSKTFYHVMNHITSIDLVPGSTDYRLMKRNVAQAIVSVTERERFTKGIYSWVGYKNKWIEYENVERVAGTTKWSFLGLIRYAYNGFIAFATTPLRSAVYLGMMIVFLSFIFAVKLYFSTISSPQQMRTGYASIMIVLLFLGGVIITILGMIGEYLARIYMEVKGRPIYIERELSLASPFQSEIHEDLEGQDKDIKKSRRM